MIEVKDLTRRYGSVWALSGVTFTIPAGQVVGFLGPNGAGKTTTMKVLTGYLAPTAGTAKVHGIDVTTDPIPAQRRIGYLPEGNPLYVELRVDECLKFAADMQGLRGAARTKAISEMLELVRMTDKRSRTTGTLSRGEKQRVGLAQALLHQPDVLVMDEPTSGLDPNQQREMRALIRRLGEKRTILFSTHILSEVEAVCDRALILSEGLLVADGTVAEIRRRGPPSTVVEVRAGPEAACAAFQGFPGVDRVEAAPVPGAEGVTRLTLSCALERGLAERLASHAASHRLPLSALSQEPASLESVFAELTTRAAPRTEEAPAVEAETSHA